MGWQFTFGVAAQLLLLVSPAVALDISYCSSSNTGSGFKQVTSTYQSNGACEVTCRDEYAFAIIQGKECWCSNTAPGDSTSSQECNEPCPGFDKETCGSSSNNLYGYFQLSLPPSGTLGPADAQTSSPPKFIDPAPPSSEQPTVTVTAQESFPSPSFFDSFPPTRGRSEAAYMTYESTSASDPTSSLTSTTLSLSITSSPAPEADNLIASVVTVTAEGTTITSTAMVTPTKEAAVGESSSTSEGTNPGKIAGIAIGAVAGIAAILGLVFWVYYRKRQRDQSPSQTPQSYEEDSPKSLPRRHASQMSQAGLIDKNSRIMTPGPAAPSGGNSAGTSISQNNRYSAGTDIRLNPNALYAHEESQHSSVSLQDNRDYSRQLQVRNPDS